MKIVILKTFPKVSDYTTTVRIFNFQEKHILPIVPFYKTKADISQRHIRFHPNN